MQLAYKLVDIYDNLLVIATNCSYYLAGAFSHHFIKQIVLVARYVHKFSALW